MFNNGVTNQLERLNHHFFAAPEIILGKTPSPKSDIWSVGALTYLMACGYPPFFESDDLYLLKKAVLADYQFNRPWWTFISDTTQNFIRNTLVVSVEDRLSAKEANTHIFLNPATELFYTASNSTLNAQISAISSYSIPKIKKRSTLKKFIHIFKNFPKLIK